MAYGMDVFERAIRQKYPEFNVVFRLFADGSVDYPLPPGAILGMKALKPFLPTRHTLFWIETIDAVPFIGEVQGVAARHLPDPAPRVREPLGFFKIHLAVLQRLVKRT